MANFTTFCKPEDFDSIDRVETTTDTLTGQVEFDCGALKEFGTGRMPFQDFFPNMAFYSGGAQGFGSLRGV